MLNPFTENNLPNLVIITGLSGSGMSSALNAFEDLGFFCVDNLPVSLLPTFSRLLLPDSQENSSIERAALVMNIRERNFLSEFPNYLEQLRQQALNVFFVFLDSIDEVLYRRFSETRRPHPNGKGEGLSEAIHNERIALQKIRNSADLVVDTSPMSVHDLRRYIIEKFSPTKEGLPLRVMFLSFGHKHGTPRDIDLMFDVRHLPNPYFVPELREFSGSDKRVVKYLNSQPEVKETIRRFEDLLEYLLPLYKREGKSYLTVGIGCTGGRHRSVMVANSLAKHLRNVGYDTQSEHRDSRKSARKKTKAKIKTAVGG